MRQRRAGGDDLGPADLDPPVVLLHRMHAHLGALVNGTIPINRRVDDGMIEKQHLLLWLLVPGPGVVMVRRVKLGVRPQGAEKRALIVRRPSEPAVGQARPGGDGVAPGELLLQLIGARK